MNISASAFAPQSLRIQAGDTVEWRNTNAMNHSVDYVSGPQAFGTGAIAGGKSQSFTFTQPGNYAYDCHFHPSMRGYVRVS